MHVHVDVYVDVDVNVDVDVDVVLDADSLFQPLKQISRRNLFCMTDF